MTLTEVADRVGTTARELAKLTGYSRQHLYMVMREGKMSAKVARRIRKAIVDFAEGEFAKSYRTNLDTYERRIKIANEIYPKGGEQ